MTAPNALLVSLVVRRAGGRPESSGGLLAGSAASLTNCSNIAFVMAMYYVGQVSFI
jgi:hypothetical protein